MLEFKLDKMTELKRVYDPALVDKALVQSLNRVTAKVKTFASKEARSDYNVKAKDINKAATLTRARKGSAEALLLYAGGRLGLEKFGAKQRGVTVRDGRYGNRRKQVRVKIKKTDQLTPAVSGDGIGGFLSPEGYVLARVGASRTKLKSLSGPSIAHMIDDAEITGAVSDLVEVELEKEFEHNLDYYLKKQIGAI